MKKLLLSVVAMLVASTSFAQNTVVASLSHGTETTIFYGSNALKDAVAAAESGDVINLSAGTFYASDISKGITLRGTGIDIDEPTYIVNDFVIEIPAEEKKAEIGSIGGFHQFIGGYWYDVSRQYHVWMQQRSYQFVHNRCCQGISGQEHPCECRMPRIGRISDFGFWYYH